MSFSQIIDSVFKNNLQIKRADIQEKITDESFRQAKYNQLPNLVFSPEGSVNWGRTLDLSTYNYIDQRVFLINGNLVGQVQLYHGGQLRSQILQNKLLVDISKSNIDKLKNELLLNVISVFLELLNNQDLLIAAQRQQSLSEITLESVQKSLTLGSRNVADLAQAKSQVSNSELTVAEIQNRINISVLNLRQLMEMKSTVEIEIQKPDLSVLERITTQYDSEKTFAEIVLNNPEIRIANKQRDYAAMDVMIAKGNFYPFITLVGSLGSNYSSARSLSNGSQLTGLNTIGYVNGTNLSVVSPSFTTLFKQYPVLKQLSDNFYQSVSITAQIPIFSRFLNRTNLRKAKLNYLDADIQVLQTRNNLEKIINQALTDLSTAVKRLKSAEANHSYTEETKIAMEKRYNAGLVSTIDYLTSINSFFKSQVDLINARYTLLFRSKIIGYYLNNPISIN